MCRKKKFLPKEKHDFFYSFNSQCEGIPGEIAHSPSSFFNQQGARGGVPLLQAEFPEAVEAAGRNASQVQRGGAVAAHPVRALGKVAVVLKIRTELSVSYRKAGAEQA